MNKNEIVAKIPQPIIEVQQQFHERYMLHNSLTIAGAFALGFLAVRAAKGFRQHKAETLLVEEIQTHLQEAA